MIKFFRKIRQKLLSENRFNKYLIYAFGEIILVVIGILIALQINNWNEENTKQKKLNSYLIALKNELNENTKQLERTAKRSSGDLLRSVAIIRNLNSDSAKYFKSDNIIDNNIGPIFKIDLYRAVFNDIINTGVLESLEDEALKRKIFRIERNLNNYDEAFSNARQIWDEYMLPYHSKHLSVTNLWDSIEYVPLPKLAFTTDIEAFVNNRDYANILSSRARQSANFERTARNIKSDFEYLILDIEKYLTDD